MTSTFAMLVGMPGSGKSTWIIEIIKKFPNRKIVYISSDFEIDEMCKNQGSTYSQGFKLFIDKAQSICNAKLANAIANHIDIVIDQTNLTVASRRKKMAQLPSTYLKYAYYFPIPDADEWKRRLSSRPGKCIPDHVLENMAKTFVMPSCDEGFDEVFTI